MDGASGAGRTPHQKNIKKILIFAKPNSILIKLCLNGLFLREFVA